MDYTFCSKGRSLNILKEATVGADTAFSGLGICLISKYVCISYGNREFEYPTMVINVYFCTIFDINTGHVAIDKYWSCRLSKERKCETIIERYCFNYFVVTSFITRRC